MGNNVDARIMNTVMNIQASSSAAHRGGACNCILHPPSCPCGPVFFRGNGGKMLCSRNLSHLFEELGAGSLPGLGINSFWAPECKCCPYRLSQRHYSQIIYGYIGQLNLSVNTFLIRIYFVIQTLKKVLLPWGGGGGEKCLLFKSDLYSSYSKPFHHKGLVDVDGKKTHAPISETFPL